MTFPQSGRVIFTKNPLEEVICQLRFPTILEIDAEKPVKFQNKIRQDYPLYEVDKPALPREISELFAGLPLPKPAESVTHKFISADSTKFISLSSEFVAFTDNEYVRWEKFSSEIRRAQNALEESHTPAFYTRIGLRYKDVIDRERLDIANEPWETLLKPALLGMLGAKDNVGAHVQEIKTEASLRLDEVPGARATVRHGIGLRGSDKKQIYIIDIDFYTTKRSNGQDVPEILQIFNRLSGDFFRWAITDKLRDKLEPRELRPED